MSGVAQLLSSRDALEQRKAKEREERRRRERQGGASRAGRHSSTSKSGQREKGKREGHFGTRCLLRTRQMDRRKPPVHWVSFITLGGHPDAPPCKRRSHLVLLCPAQPFCHHHPMHPWLPAFLERNWLAARNKEDQGSGKATRRMGKLETKTLEERLNKLGMFSLEKRRLGRDMMSL